jgi:hypothetical protein
MTGLILAASVVVAALSWRLVEQPFLRGAVRWPPLRTGLAATAGVAAVAGAIWLAQGFPARFSPESRALFAAREDVNPTGRRCLYSGGPPIPYDRNCVFGAPGAEPTIAIWADSQGAELAVALGQRLATRGGAVMQVTASGCPPVLGYRDHLRPDCARHNAETLARLMADRRIARVVMAANFHGYAGVLSPEQIEAGFAPAVRRLRAAGKRVTLVEPIPVFPYDPPKALGLRRERGDDPEQWGISRAAYETANAPFLRMLDELARTAGADRIRTADLFCDAQLCRAFSRSEGVLYFDANHPSVTGARRIAAVLPVPEDPRRSRLAAPVADVRRTGVEIDGGNHDAAFRAKREGRAA